MTKKEIAELLRSKAADIARESVDQQYKQNPDLLKKFGSRGKDRSVEDAGYNIASLADAIEMDSPAMFSSYVSWLSVLLGRIGLKMDDLVNHFEILKSILTSELPAEAATVISEYVNEGHKKVRASTECDQTLIKTTNPYHDLAQKYLTLLLKGKKREASSIIVEQAEKGVPVKDLYLSVFQPVQHEIGRLWQTNQISVGEEHYVTAVTQLTISLLYPYIFSTKKNGFRMISTTVSTELHELGIRMITDLFESEGWDTWFLGASTPGESLIRMMNEHRPDVIAVSVTLASHIKRMESLVSQIRENQTHNPKIIVGGQGFINVPEKWIKQHSDGYSGNAETAIMMVNELIGNN